MYISKLHTQQTGLPLQRYLTCFSLPSSKPSANLIWILRGYFSKITNSNFCKTDLELFVKFERHNNIYIRESRNQVYHTLFFNIRLEILQYIRARNIALRHDQKWKIRIYNIGNVQSIKCISENTQNVEQKCRVMNQIPFQGKRGRTLMRQSTAF